MLPGSVVHGHGVSSSFGQPSTSGMSIAQQEVLKAIDGMQTIRTNKQTNKQWGTELRREELKATKNMNEEENMNKDEESEYV